MRCLANAPVYLFFYFWVWGEFWGLLRPIGKPNSAVHLKRSHIFVSLLCHPPRPPLPGSTILAPHRLQKLKYAVPFRDIAELGFVWGLNETVSNTYDFSTS